MLGEVRGWKQRPLLAWTFEECYMKEEINLNLS
jgi:hypothetical protein